MTGAMSLFPGSSSVHHPALLPQHSHPALPTSLFKSEIKNKLGFSIDSIVGKSARDSEPAEASKPEVPRSPVSPGAWLPEVARPPSSSPKHQPASPPPSLRLASRGEQHAADKQTLELEDASYRINMMVTL